MVGNEPTALKTEKNSNICQDIEKDINKIEKDINSLKLQQKNCISKPVERVKFEGLGDDDSICSNELEDKLPSIPDGGWGWAVVFAAFLASACADGLAYSFGILHEEFTNYFETSQSKTSLIGSLFISIPLISGPIMSALVDRYGCRIMTIIAGLVATVGFLLAALSNSVMMLCLTLGVISGLAMGILYVTSVVSVAFWFDKRRTLAVSLAACGTGFGTLVYSPLTNFFIDICEWRNALVLLAGTILNMCVCGALMRDPDWVIIKEKREKRERKKAKARSRKSSSAGSISSKSIGDESFYLATDVLNDLITSEKSPEYILKVLTTSLAEAEQFKATTQMNSEQLYKKVNSTIHLPTIIQKHEQKWYHRIIDGFKSTFDMRMFTEFHFLLFNIGSLILFIWSIIPYFFLKSYMTSTNVEGGVLMISIIGIASGVGIVALGWAGDQPWMNVTKGYAVCLFCCGLSVGAYPLFITNYWALAVVSTIFGLSYASSYSYTPAILMELIPIDYFTIGYGFILLSQGLGHMIGPPLGGLLFDITGRWDITFYAGGVWLIIAGFFIGLIAYINNFRICGTSPLLNEEDIDSTKNSTVYMSKVPVMTTK